MSDGGVCPKCNQLLSLLDPHVCEEPQMSQEHIEGVQEAVSRMTGPLEEPSEKIRAFEKAVSELMNDTPALQDYVKRKAAELLKEEPDPVCQEIDEMQDKYPELDEPDPKYTIGLNAEGDEEKFPQVWMSKVNGSIFVVVPWWDMMEEDIFLKAKMLEVNPTTRYERKIRIGGLAQVGWLIDNGKGVFFGVGLDMAKSMEVIGEF